MEEEDMILKADAVLGELKFWMLAYQEKLTKIYGEGKIPQVIQIRMKTVLNELTMLILEKWTEGAQAQMKGGSHEGEPGLSRSAPSTTELSREDLQNQYLKAAESAQLRLQDRHFQILMPILEEDLTAKKEGVQAINRLSNVLMEQLPRLTTQLRDSLAKVEKVINLLD